MTSNESELLDRLESHIYSKLSKNKNKEYKLKNLVDEIMVDLSLNFEIDTTEVAIHLKKKIKKFSNFELNIRQDKKNKYFIKLNLINNRTEEKTTLYSVLIFINIMFYIIISRILEINNNTDIMIVTLLISSYIIKNDNFKLLLFTLPAFMLLETKNTAIIFIIMIVGITSTLTYAVKVLNETNENTLKDRKEKTKIEFALILFKIMLFFFTLVSFVLIFIDISQYFISIKDYVILKSIIIFILIIWFSILNRFNILHITVFALISFTAYNLITNIGKMLDEKNIIFYPYTDTINLDISLLSVAISILIFTNQNILHFFRVLSKMTNLKIIATTAISILVGNIIILLFYQLFNIIYIYFIYYIIIALLFSMIYITNKEICPKFFPKKIFNYEKKILNQNNTVKNIDNITNFLDPLNKEKNIKFDLEAHSKNICFIIVSFYIIINFFTSYTNIYHYKLNEKSCRNLSDKILISPTNNEGYVYALYDKNQKIIMDVKNRNEKIKKNNYEEYIKLVDITKEDLEKRINDTLKYKNFLIVENKINKETLKLIDNRLEELNIYKDMLDNKLEKYLKDETLLKKYENLEKIKIIRNSKIQETQKIINNLKETNVYTGIFFKTKINKNGVWDIITNLSFPAMKKDETEFHIYSEKCEKI